MSSAAQPGITRGVWIYLFSPESWATEMGQVDEDWMTVYRKRRLRSRGLFEHVHLWKGRLTYYHRLYREIGYSDRVLIPEVTDDRKRQRTNNM